MSYYAYIVLTYRFRQIYTHMQTHTFAMWQNYVKEFLTQSLISLTSQNNCYYLHWVINIQLKCESILSQHVCLNITNIPRHEIIMIKLEIKLRNYRNQYYNQSISSRTGYRIITFGILLEKWFINIVANLYLSLAEVFRTSAITIITFTSIHMFSFSIWSSFWLCAVFLEIYSNFMAFFG